MRNADWHGFTALNYCSVGKADRGAAWACLEVEMNPDNVGAIALKERLKREPGFFGGKAEKKTSRRVTRNRPEQLGAEWPGCATSRPCWNAM